MLDRKNKSNIVVKLIYLIAFITFLNFLGTIGITYMNYRYYSRDFNIKIDLGKHRVDINKAGIKELSTLSGIGKGTAKEIIEGRPYKSTGELYEKGIIGIKTFNNIKDSITVAGE